MRKRREKETDMEDSIKKEIHTTMAYGGSSLGLNPTPISFNNLNKDFKTKDIVEKDILD